MTHPREHKATKSERTLLSALLLSSPGPLVTGISAMISLSTTQIADFLRRSTELVAIFMSWWIYRKLHHTQLDSAEQFRLERMADMIVGSAMGCSGILMLILTAFRLSSDRLTGNVTLGLTIAVLGLLVNTWFWFRYRFLAQGQSSAVIQAQQALYRAKACVDMCVVVALAAVALAPLHPATRWVDIVGSAIVACFLLWTGVKMIRQKRASGISADL